MKKNNTILNWKKGIILLASVSTIMVLAIANIYTGAYKTAFLPPTVTAYALSASCTNSIPNDDGYLQISAAINATHYDFTIGNTYTGAGFASATAFIPFSDLPLQFGTLPNPTTSQDYTIRVFNGSDEFTDVVVTLAPQTDCSGGCVCEEFIFLNDTQSESVHKFLVVGDTVDEILAPNGGPWLQNIVNPHGIGMDLNGFLYIGDRTLDASDQRALWRLTCDGQLVNNDVTGATEFSALNLDVIGNTLYSYDANGIKAWSTCDGSLLEGYDPETGICNVSDADRDDAWGFVRTDSVFYGSRYIDVDLPDGTPVVIFDVYEFPTDYTAWGPDCSIPIFFSDTLYSPGLERIWGLSRDPATGNFVTVATEHSVSGRPSVVYMWDDQGNLLDTLRDDTNDLTGFAGTRGITYSPELGKFVMATQNGDCMSLVGIDSNGELEYEGPLIPFVSDSQGKGLSVVKECCPTNNRQVVDYNYCVEDASEVVYLNEIYVCGGTVCEGTWVQGDGDGSIAYEDCDQSVSLVGAEGCATFTKSSDGVGNNLQCGAFEITMTVCFHQPPEATAYALSASCTNNIPNNDGYLQISSASSTSTHYDYTVGSTYTGVGFSSATAFDPTTDLPLQFGTLANPAVDTDYTIRIFNGASGCFTDVVVTLIPQTDCSGGCDCEEYLYLNDTGFGEVHKFSVNPTTGEITEIGAPWMSGFTNPHGLGTDLNGNFYVGDDPTGPIYKVNCDGGTVTENATLWYDNYENGLTNMGSYQNYIITNGYRPGSNGNYLTVHDACTGNVLGQICLNDVGSGPWSSDWGLQVLDDGTVLATDGQGFGPDADRAIWMFQFDPALIDSGNCIDAFATDDSNSYLSGVYDVMGITTDGNYLYVMTRNNIAVATLLKIDANTGALVASITDNPNDGFGWHSALGLVYAPSSGYLYVSGYEDCIAIVDTADLSYQGPGNGSIPFGAIPKAISLKNECCPTSNRQTIDQTFCISDASEIIFLNEIYDCPGVVCEGMWQAQDLDGSVAYEGCDQSVTLSGTGGCATFVKSSNGTGNNLQCGAFVLTMNVEFVYNVPATLSDTIACLGQDFTLTPTIDTLVTNVTYQWQSSSISCETGFADISGATSLNYTSTLNTDTMYYRLLTTVTGDCSTGNCTEVSNCATVTAECITPPIFDLALNKKLSAGQSPYIAPGDVVSFDIEVFNQGETAAYDIIITDYMPAGYTFNTALNPNWNSSGTNYETSITGPLAAGDSTTVSIQLTVINPFNATQNDLVNYAEISAADDDTDDTNTPPTDADSTPDTNPTNDAGGTPDGADDDTIGGDGTGAPLDGTAATDEDDQDPAFVSIFDLALTKKLSAGQSEYVTSGQIISYDIEVFNQGTVAAYDIVVTDYVPSSLIFNPTFNPNWTNNGGNYQTTITGPLAAGASTIITVLLTVPDPYTNDVSGLTNYAEISAADDDTDDTNTPPTDADSTPDTNPNNDPGGTPDQADDNYTDGNGTGAPLDSNAATDEDDQDPASVKVFDLSITKKVISVQSGN